MTVTEIAAGAAKKAPRKRAPKREGFAFVAPDRKAFAEALGTAGRALSSSGSVPILSGLKLALAGDTLTVTGTDLELFVEIEIEVHGQGDGVVVVPGRLLERIVRSASGDVVEIADVKPLKGQLPRVSVKAGEFAAHLSKMDADSFPAVPNVAGDTVSVDGPAFVKAVRRTRFAVSKDTSRPILTGIGMQPDGDGMTLVATDSYRLAATSFDTKLSSVPVIVPARALSELVSKGSADEETIEVKIDETSARFSANGRTITVRLIEGEFPSWRQLVPEETPVQVVTNRLALLDAIGRVRLLASGDTPVVRMRAQVEGLEVEAHAADVGDAAERLEAEMVGDPTEMAFNAEYLTAALRAGDDESTLVKLGLPERPAVISEDGWTVLLMPVRIGEKASSSEDGDDDETAEDAELDEELADATTVDEESSEQ